MGVAHQLAKTLWDAGEPPIDWGELTESEQDEWVVMAKAGMSYVLDEIVMPEYMRWRDTEEISALGAVANIGACLVTDKPFAV